MLCCEFSRTEAQTDEASDIMHHSRLTCFRHANVHCQCDVLSHWFMCTISHDGSEMCCAWWKHSLSRGNNSCDHSSSNTVFGSFLHLPQKRHYASHIYIPCNICQTFINYKLMKCSTALWDHSNEHMGYYVNFWHIFVKFNVFCIITVY